MTQKSCLITLMKNTNDRTIALAQYLDLTGEDIDQLSISSHDDTIIEYGKEEYMVFTDDEADSKWEESLESYIDDCILPELPEVFRMYFDDEAWKRDARHYGRGHSLSQYDGSESESGDYYIYRMN